MLLRVLCLQFILLISPINKHTSLVHPESLHILPTKLVDEVEGGPLRKGTEALCRFYSSLST